MSLLEILQRAVWFFTNVGIDLRSSVFSHDQLYEAVSRVTDAKRLHVLLPENDSSIDNVVYPEVGKLFDDHHIF